MGVLDLFRRKPAVDEKSLGTLSNPSPELMALFGAAPTAAGQVVTPETAVRCAAVNAAVRAIAEPIGTLPVQVYRRGDGEARERDRDHPAYELLHDRSNPWTSAVDFKRQVTLDALLHGNGFALVVRVDGKPKELHRLPPRSVTVDVSTGEPVYKVTEAVGGVRQYDWRDILHVSAPISHDGLMGQSPVLLAREAIGLAMAMESHGSRLFANGARPSGVLSFPGKLGDEAFASLKSSWDAAHTGKAAGGTAVLEEGGSWTALTFSSVDSQFLEMRKFAIDEIGRAFGVPPSLLFELGRATWGNASEQGQTFLTYSLLPWIKRWEAAISRTLISEDERADVWAEFLVDDFLRADFAKRMAGYSVAIANRTLSPNEVRAREGLPGYEGGDEFANPHVQAGSSPPEA